MTLVVIVFWLFFPLVLIFSYDYFLTRVISVCCSIFVDHALQFYGITILMLFLTRFFNILWRYFKFTGWPHLSLQLIFILKYLLLQLLRWFNSTTGCIDVGLMQFDQVWDEIWHGNNAVSGPFLAISRLLSAACRCNSSFIISSRWYWTQGVVWNLGFMKHLKILSLCVDTSFIIH